MRLPLLRAVIPPDIWPRMESDYDELMHGSKKAFITRTRMVRTDGTEIWVTLTLRCIDWLGKPALMLTAFDISAQVEIEQHLLKNEQRQRAVLEILPYPILIIRRMGGQILFVNRKSCMLFQSGAHQLLRGNIEEFYLDPSDKEMLTKLFDSVPDVRDIEVRMRTAQGRVFTAEIAAIGVDYRNTPAILIALNDISQRKEMEAELFRQASTDALTGIINRRYFQNQAEQELRRARRFSRDMAVMMIDIDYFKKINDTRGHAVGDTILQGVVRRSVESLRQSDTMGRIGGEEFAVLLPETTLEAAYDVAERLRVHIEERPFIVEATPIACTVSIGVAHLEANDLGVEGLLHRADQALYRAKGTGRNRVETDRGASEKP